VGYQLIVASHLDNVLQITLLANHEGKIYRQIYDQKCLPATSKHQFTSAKEMFLWLDKYKEYGEQWKVVGNRLTVTFEKDNVLEMELVSITNFTDISTVFLQELWEVRRQHWHTYQLTQTLSGQQEAQTGRVKDIEARVKILEDENKLLRSQFERTAKDQDKQRSQGGPDLAVDDLKR
jgi:hypothetical protein